MLKLMGKKIFTILGSKICLSKCPYIIVNWKQSKFLLVLQHEVPVPVMASISVDFAALISCQVSSDGNRGNILCHRVDIKGI